MTVTEFITKHKPKFKAVRVGTRPNKSTWHKDATHYLITLATDYDEYLFFYSMGSAHKAKPIFTDLLESLASDCQLGELTYKEAYLEMGDVGKDTWMSCRECRDSMINLLGRRGYEDFLSIDFD